MTVVLYRNNSASNVVSKQLTTVATYQGTLRSPSSIISPVITLQMEATTSFNYVGIPDFGRFYFVKNVVATSSNLVTVSCHVDVLMTYNSNIRGFRAVVARNEFDYNLYLDDGIFKAQQNPKIKRISFPNVTAFGKFSYCFTIGGNGDYVPPEPGPEPGETVTVDLSFRNGGIDGSGNFNSLSYRGSTTQAYPIPAKPITYTVTSTSSLTAEFLIRYFNAATISSSTLIGYIDSSWHRSPFTETSPDNRYVALILRYSNDSTINKDTFTGTLSYEA